MQPSRRVQSVQTPVIPLIAELIRENPETISFGQGVVGYPPPDSVKLELNRFNLDPENNKYQSLSGIDPLKELIVEKLKIENNITINKENRNCLMVTAGSNQAFLNVALAILDPDDEVILPIPYYFNHEMAIVMANARPVLVSTDNNYQLDIDLIKKSITPKTRAIVTVSPNNPSGAVYSESSLKEINQLCAKYGIYHINDEAYEYFIFDNNKHFSPGSSHNAAEHTISLYSMSKSYGFASWRIGWMTFPQNLEPALKKIQDTVIICPPVISQYAALGALKVGPKFIPEKLAALNKIRRSIRSRLTELEDEQLANISPSSGALYYLIRLKSNLSSIDYASYLIRNHKVAAIPGEAFGLSQECQVRLSFGSLNIQTAEEGIDRFINGVKEIYHSQNNPG
jgi:aspartate/methionine/tyrosine aminotransferase